MLLIFKAVYWITLCRIKQKQRKPESALRSTNRTLQTETSRGADRAACQTSSAVYENDNKAYVNITDTVNVPEYAGLERANEYSNTAHIYSHLKWICLVVSEVYVCFNIYVYFHNITPILSITYFRFLYI